MKNFETNISAFGNLMVNALGFREYLRTPSGEVCWRATVPGTVFAIQVRSGMTKTGSFTPAPDIGIRVYLVDNTTGAPVVPIVRVRRTQHSLRNVRKQVNTYWKHVLTHKDRSGRNLIIKD